MHRERKVTFKIQGVRGRSALMESESSEYNEMRERERRCAGSDDARPLAKRRHDNRYQPGERMHPRESCRKGVKLKSAERKLKQKRE